MKTLMGLSACLLVCVVSGCTASSGVINAGPDTYSVVITGNGYSTVGEVKAAAYKEANAFCQEQGKVLVPISTNETQPDHWTGTCASYDLTFRALDEDDPEVQRPTLRAVPNVRVEVDPQGG